MIYPEKWHCDNCGGEETVDEVMTANEWVTVRFHRKGWDRHYCSRRCVRDIFRP